MSPNDNTVNIERRSYHHGDLREALLVEGLRLLATREADALSLREVARGVGVSATSVYRHFPDKEALMAALAQEGMAQLSQVQTTAADAAGGGEAGFTATGRAYVRFALANPALFRLISTAPARWKRNCGEDCDARKLLMANAAASAGIDLADPATRVHALHAWSLVHGLAMLMLDGQVPADDALIDQVIGGCD